MVTKEEAYQHLIDTIDELYPQEIRGSEENHIPIEVFGKTWHKITDEEYRWKDVIFPQVGRIYKKWIHIITKGDL